MIDELKILIGILVGLYALIILGLIIEFGYLVYQLTIIEISIDKDIKELYEKIKDEIKQAYNGNNIS